MNKLAVGLSLIYLFSSGSVAEVIWNFETKTEASKKNQVPITKNNSDVSYGSLLKPNTEIKKEQAPIEIKQGNQEQLDPTIQNARKSTDDLIRLVKSTPEVREAENNIKLSDWEVAKIKSDLGPKMSLSSAGGYKIFSNLDQNHRRHSNEKGFLDTSVKVSKNIYDSGRSDFLVDSEQFRKKAKEFEYNIVLREVYAEALLTGQRILNILDLLSSLDVTIEELKKSRNEEKLRYFSGTGTSTIIKELDLLAIDLINQKQILQFKLNLERENFEKRFSEPADDYLQVLKISQPVTSIISDVNDLNNLEVVQQFELEKEAIEFTISARKRTNRPSLNLEMNADFYDVDEGELQQYELNGGINLNFPFFDSDFVENDIRSLLAQKNIIELKKNKRTESLRLAISKLGTSDSEIEQELKANELKILNLEDKLAELELRSTSIEANGLEKARTSARIQELQRNELKLVSKKPE